MFKLLRRHAAIKTLNSFIKCFSLARKNHYEVLRLRRNCTDKEIKEAFIKLSKEYHPDKNKDADAQHQFVRIVEAYNVLGKRGSRAQYDHLSEPSSYGKSYKTGENDRYNKSNASYHYESYAQRPHQKQYQYQQAKNTYYGGLGIKRIPNYVLIMLCFGIAFVGTILQVFVIREMYVVQRRQAMERSQYLAEELEKVRQAAEGNTNEMQTRILIEKIVGSAHPTIATASLGQALASAEKE